MIAFMYGSHLSIAGGMHLAIAKARELGLATVQVFTKNQQQWKVPPLSEESISAWSAALKESGFSQTVSHDSYLINLATADAALREKSVALFVEEIRRCNVLGIPYLVTHPGAHLGAGEDVGLARVAKALDEIHAEIKTKKVITCLEITAGQGSSLGYKLEHLATIIDRVKHPERLGVCLDTAHLFAAGYDFRGKLYAAFRKELETTVGLDRVKVWHLNDSKKPLGSRVDRHDHIGVGTIGLEGFRPIVRDKLWKKTPKILETAKELSPEGRPWDAVNLDVLRSLEA